MNQTLNFRRFNLLLRKSVFERPVGVIGTALMGLGATFLIYFFFQSMGAFHPAQDISFAVGLVGGGCLLASAVFGYFASESNGISYLTIPGSNLEKWLVGIFITITYIALFLGYFRLIDHFFVGMYHSRLDLKDPRYHDQYASVWEFSFTLNIEFWTFFLLCISTMLVGGIHFNKLAFIKTSLTILLLLFFVFVINSGIAHVILPHVLQATPFEGVEFTNGSSEAYIALSAEISEKLFWLLGIGYPITLLVISFIKLKEKEI